MGRHLDEPVSCFRNTFYQLISIFTNSDHLEPHVTETESIGVLCVVCVMREEIPG